ncbi:unnamed protein product [Lepeophtheirus salmonis]|uniref:(salmon louse) hypothetical protein n=1 Tax=Lepeophtheirus salmonis TaxID=72036 RepID=A0A0K2U024_LEPSM|nr:unnamed protein product [Lepeophtheirus salmonis]CAF2781277.1 unnamed protein product [Lepeophtheirus salmonis]
MLLESILMSFFVLVPGHRLTPGSNYTYISPWNGQEYTSNMRPLVSLNIKELRENGPELGFDEEFLSRECVKSASHCMIEMKIKIRRQGEDDENIGFDFSKPLGQRIIPGFKHSDYRTFENSAFEEEARIRKLENDRGLAFVHDAINEGMESIKDSKSTVAYTVTVILSIIGAIAAVCVCIAVSVGCYIGCQADSNDDNTNAEENVRLNEVKPHNDKTEENKS